MDSNIDRDNDPSASACIRGVLGRKVQKRERSSARAMNRCILATSEALPWTVPGHEGLDRTRYVGPSTGEFRRHWLPSTAIPAQRVCFVNLRLSR